MTGPSPTPRRRRWALVLAFAIGAAWIWLVSWFADAVLGDDDRSWAEIAARSAMGGVVGLVMATVVPPRRFRAIQRAVASAIHRGRLPDEVDPELWRAALLHQRSSLWVWRWLFPAIFAGFAVVCAGAAFFVAGGALAAVLGIGLVLNGAAVGCRVFARRRHGTLDGLLAELDERGVHAG